jgi:diguanylate cyclase (GGDEF)-like protein
MNKPNILVVDDDAFFRTFCSEVLRGEGYAVRVAASGTEALEVVGRDGADLILADIYMPEMTGLELLESVKASNPSSDVVIMTGYASIETALQAMKRGAADYLRKPFAAQELAAVVQATLAQRRLYEENERLKKQLELYEISRPFSSLDEPIRVLDLGLEALLHVSGAEAGLYLHSGSELQFMALLHRRGLELDAARAVRETLVTRGLRHLRSLDRVQALGRTRLSRILGDAVQVQFRSALLVPMLQMGATEGAFALFFGDRSRVIKGEDSDNVQFVSKQVELSYALAKRMQEARRLAFIDSLTDLYNARYLDTVLEESIKQFERMGTPFSVLFLDLDYFKEINDAYGHLVGGKVLIEVSRILKGAVREGDIVIRYGGDEFTVVLSRTDSKTAQDVAERVRRAIKEHAFLGREGRSIRLTASIGVATYPDDARSREELVDQADRAMYRGKESTRDAVYLASSH